MKPTDALTALFRQEGLRITPQRRMIFQVLEGDGSHPTADEIYRRVVAVMPEVSRTTVYNTLRELVALGEISPVEALSESGVRYDTNNNPHHHLFCIHCHALVDVNHEFDSLPLPSEEARGYRILRSQITFYGVCPDCQPE